MVSKTSLREIVRGHRWRELGPALADRPDLLDARDERGRTWLHLCCATPGDAADSIRAADLLIDLGLGLEEAAFTEGEWRATPLWYAVSWGKNYALAEHLLKRGALPRYSLFAAVWNNDSAMIRLLLAHGADIEGDSAGDDSPLLGAVAWSRFGPAATLLEAGADPNARDAKGRTALHLMLGKGSAAEHFRLFARHGARGDIADAQGRTAAELLRRKRKPGYREVADQLATNAQSA